MGFELPEMTWGLCRGHLKDQFDHFEPFFIFSTDIEQILILKAVKTSVDITLRWTFGKTLVWLLNLTESVSCWVWVLSVGWNT